jgi:3',5'-cyclic AMP phosphodiesterase CpdA
MTTKNLEDLTNDEQAKLDLLKGLTATELQEILKHKGQEPKATQVYHFPDRNTRFGVISDSHIGNKCYDAQLMDFAAKVFRNRKVDFIVHVGDICDGLYTNRPGHYFELEHIGADEQVDRAILELTKLGEAPLFFITGNHCWNTFFKNAGYDIGKRIEERIANSTYLGNAHGSIDIAGNSRVDLIHPDGGTAYSISYRPQKIIESLSGGAKPGTLLIGHFHKAEYLFYRNVHAIQTGCLESQTPFMAGKHIAAHKGFWVITIKTNKSGIANITPEFYPAYD